MNALLRKALGLLAVFMMAGMAYLAFSSHGSHATLPSLSIDAYTTQLGSQCRYGMVVKHKYLGFKIANGPHYVWKNNTPLVLIMQGADSILLNTATGNARKWNGNRHDLDPSVAQVYARDWYRNQLAALGIYSHLMTPATKSFVAGTGSDRIQVIYPDNSTKGGASSIWAIDNQYLPVSCTLKVGSDTLVASWMSWQWTPDSLRIAAQTYINGTGIDINDLRAADEVKKLTGMATSDF